MCSKKCVICGNLMEKKNYRNFSRLKYCSVECSNENQRRKYRDVNISVGVPTGTVGAIGELRVCVDLMMKGDEVFRAVSPSCSSDLAVLRDGKLERIEVRTGHISNTGKIFCPKPPKHKCDILAVVMPDSIEYLRNW